MKNNKNAKSNDNNETEAVTLPVKTLSIIWIVPIIAILAGLWMVYDTISKRGPEITLTMSNAEGVEAGKTVIKVLNVNIGKVDSVKLAPDNKSVILTAQLDYGTDRLLRKDTQLWIIKPRFDRSGISGLSTLVSGAYIQLQPGKSTLMGKQFEVLPNPPITALNVPGLRINIISDETKALNVGDSVLYHGYPVGRIETVKLDPDNRTISYRVFIEQAYAKLVTINTRFWNSSGLQIKTGIDGIKFNTGTLESMLSGGIEFDIPEGLQIDKPAKNLSIFTLYADQDSINESVDSRQINYIALFDDSIRGLSVGAPVEYHGLRVGTVKAVPYTLPNDKTDQAFTQKSIMVLLRLEPSRMESFLGKHSESSWKNEINKAMKHGLSARLKSGSLVTGAVFVDLNFDNKRKGQKLSYINGIPVIPTSSGVLAQMETKISALLDKLNALPLGSTVKNVNKTLDSADQMLAEIHKSATQLNNILSQNDTQHLPAKVQQTLDKMQKALEGLSPDAPAYQGLKSAINNLNQLILEATPVIRTINEKPNSLIFNRTTKDKQPEGIRP